jgi:4'-phosphopantetheinyl transferase
MRAETQLGWLLESSVSVPRDSLDWLGPREREVLAGLSFPKRRADWLLGRWTAKRTVRAWMADPGPAPGLAEIEILGAPDGAPDVFVRGAAGRCAVSISHSAGRALCVVAEAALEPGCDIEAVEPRSPEFLSDYFVEEEDAFVSSLGQADLALGATLIWSAKESALKSLREGLRRDTRSAVVRPCREGPPAEWQRFRVECGGSRPFFGWWKLDEGSVLTAGSACATATLRLLR